MSENALVREQTYGEKAVGLQFNPSGMSEVDRIKQKYAEIIDMLNDFRNEKNPSLSQEARRMASIAITEAQTSCMWAVKSFTWID